MLDTIVALATPPVKGALAIIRISGQEAFETANKIVHKPIEKDETRKISYRFILDNGRTVDEVIVLSYVGPKTFTGEDLIEIICHGSMLIVNEIMEILLKYGARMATKGEFSSRAFLHGRIDLIQAEAINDLINATSVEAKNLSMLSLEGKTSQMVVPLKIQIADLLSLIEVNIDYPEYEDIEQVNKEKIVHDVTDIHEHIAKLIQEGHQGKIIKEGIDVAIIGKPNVGKSSLLNALLKEDKAIVTDIAGTTRDIVEGQVNLNGVVLRLLDTAGIRESEDKIESIGIEKAKKTIESAELVILVMDASRHLDQDDQILMNMTEHKKRIIVYNKGDVVKQKDAEKLYISALNKDISGLEKAIHTLFDLQEESYLRPSLNNVRQLGLLAKADQALLKAKEDALVGLSIDLISVSLQEAYHAILDILGEENQNDLSTEIFSRFCLGK